MAWLDSEALTWVERLGEDPPPPLGLVWLNFTRESLQRKQHLPPCKNHNMKDQRNFDCRQQAG